MSWMGKLKPAPFLLPKSWWPMRLVSGSCFLFEAFYDGGVVGVGFGGGFEVELGVRLIGLGAFLEDGVDLDNEEEGKENASDDGGGFEGFAFFLFQIEKHDDEKEEKP